ncbi:MAG TPA: acyltransferase [Salinarimonas sp.]|nr:acyltransferase [Salinarimonas sp.]
MSVSERDGIAGPAPGGADRRIVELDGIRGLMTILVVISHFFAELPGGHAVFAHGWVAVTMFFVLSGFLVGRLILEKGHHDNFYTVFYVRRFCRTIPIYVVCVLGSFLVFSQMPARWSDFDAAFPLWSYLTFSQNFLMISSGSIGAYWLAPTWTLTVEEHFYLVAPALMLLTPRRHLVAALMVAILAALALRALLIAGGLSPMAGLVLFPARADLVIVGLLAAALLLRGGIAWERLDGLLRVAPVLLLTLAAGLGAVVGSSGALFKVVGPLIVAVACAAFLLAVVRGAPEARRFRSPVLRFFGWSSYAVYLTHLPIFWLMHGLILGEKPALGTPEQWAVSLLALPVCALAGWGLTRLVEEPISNYGRTWTWGSASAAGGARRAVEPPSAMVR